MPSCPSVPIFVATSVVAARGATRLALRSLQVLPLRNLRVRDEERLRYFVVGNEHLAEHGFGLLENFVRGFAKFYPALEAALERTLAPAPRVDLRFHHDELVARAEKFFGDGFGLFGSGADFAGRDRDAVLREKLFGLVFVNFHVRASRMLT